MTKLTVRNLTNSPFDIEDGHRLPAMGSVTAEFSDQYAALLRRSPGVDVVEAVEAPAPAATSAPKADAPRKRSRKA